MRDMIPQGFQVEPDGPGRHEPSEIRLGGILAFLGGLAAVSLGVYFALGGMMRSFDREQERRPAVTTRRLADPSGQFPGPRLQENPSYDMDAFRKDENRRLSTYGWVDESRGVARIPIDRAIDIVAEKGIGTDRKEEP